MKHLIEYINEGLQSKKIQDLEKEHKGIKVICDFNLLSDINYDINRLKDSDIANIYVVDFKNSDTEWEEAMSKIQNDGFSIIFKDNMVAIVELNKNVKLI